MDTRVPLLRGRLRVLLFVVGVGVVMKRDLRLLISQWKTYATLGVILGLFFVSDALIAKLVIGIPSTGMVYMLLQYFISNAGAVFAAT